MMHILFICPYPLGKSPSQRFRFEQYFHFLQERDITYEVHPFMGNGLWDILYTKGHMLKKIFFLAGCFVRRWVLLFRCRKADYVFIHREVTPFGPPVFEWIIAKIFKVKIIYDFDDAIWMPQLTQASGAVTFLRNASKVNAIIRWSFKVSCGNAYLANHALKYNAGVFVNPTTVDTELRHNRMKDQQTETLIVGWTGSHSTLMYLEPIVPLLEKVYQVVPFEFYVICDRPLRAMPSFATFIPWNAETEIEDLLNLNVGVMPLVQDQWTEGKCGFKAIQYMALGIPAIVSPVGVNKNIVDHGVNGYICENDQEWEEALLKLLRQEKLRIEMGREARLKIIQHYSVSSNKNNFLALFED